MEKVAFTAGNARQVEIDPRHPEIIYVSFSNAVPVENEYKWRGDAGNMIIRSCDGGKTFRIISSGSEDSVIRTGVSAGYFPKDIVVNPQNGEFYAACHNYGLNKLMPPYER